MAGVRVVFARIVGFTHLQPKQAFENSQMIHDCSSKQRKQFNIQVEEDMPACLSVLPAVRGRTARCLYSVEDKADSSTQDLCLHTLWHTRLPLHTAEIQR